jgi:hypothetical protein
MNFLKTTNINQMMILCNSKIYKLTKPQVTEISMYKNNKPYNNHWLIVNSLFPYFKVARGKFIERIVYIDKDLWVYNKYRKTQNQPNYNID